MRILRKTAHRSILVVVKESTSFGVGKRAAPQLARTLLAALLAALLVVAPLSPAFAQSGAQNPPPNPAPSSSPAPQGSTIAPVGSLGLATRNYAKGPRAFPNILN